MKTKAGLILLACVAAIPSAADVIGFDDLLNFTAVPPGYHGLNWPGFATLDGINYISNPSGYQAGVISSDYVIYGYGSASITAPSFDFISAYATAAWYDNLQLRVQGLIHGTVVYDNTYTLSAKAPTFIQFNYFGVDEVDFTSSGGTQHTGYTGSGNYFALDDVGVQVYNPYRQYIQNGGFESGVLSPWIQSGATDHEVLVTNADYVHSGTWGLRAGPVASLGFLNQTVQATRPGESYLVSFWLEVPLAGTPNAFQMNWEDETVINLTNQPAFSWTNLQAVVSTWRPRTQIQFGFYNNPEFYGFDDVSVSPVLVVSNGGFETGDFSGWTTNFDSNNSIATAAPSYVRSGTYGGEFGNVGSLGHISESLPTLTGQNYLISFWLDSYDSRGPSEFMLSWGGRTVIDMTNMPAFGWTNMHFVVTATSPTSTLDFGMRHDPAFMGLDEVSVIPWPLVTNGDFEADDLSGWTASGVLGVDVDTNHLFVSSGNYGLALGSFGGLGYITQTVQTLPKQYYLLSFWLDTPDGLTPNEFLLNWDGNQVFDQQNLAATGWINWQIIVAASSTNTELQFGFRDDPSFLGLDEITLTPVVLPVITSITESAGVLNFTWNTMPGFVYQLQTSTDLKTWTPIGSPQTAMSPTMSGSFTIGPAPHRFYRVHLLQPAILS